MNYIIYTKLQRNIKYTKLQCIYDLILLFTLLSPIYLLVKFVNYFFLVKYVNYYSAGIFIMVLWLYGFIIVWFNNDLYLNEYNFELIICILNCTIYKFFITYPVMFYHYLRSLIL